MGQEREKAEVVRQLLGDPRATRELVKKLRKNRPLKKAEIALSSGKSIFATDLTTIALAQVGAG